MTHTTAGSRRPRVICHMASSIVVPVADGEVGRAAVFDVNVEAQGAALRHRERPLVLRSLERRPDNILWLRYQLETPMRVRRF